MRNRVGFLLLALVATIAVRCSAPDPAPFAGFDEPDAASASPQSHSAESRPAHATPAAAPSPAGAPAAAAFDGEPVVEHDEILRDAIPLELFGGPDVAKLTFRRSRVGNADYFTIQVDRGADGRSLDIQLPALFRAVPGGWFISIGAGEGDPEPGRVVSILLPLPGCGDVATSYAPGSVEVEADQGQGRLGVLQIGWTFLDGGDLLLQLSSSLYGERSFFLRERLDATGPVSLTLNRVATTPLSSIWRKR